VNRDVRFLKRFQRLAFFVGAMNAAVKKSVRIALPDRLDASKQLAVYLPWQVNG
jgi:hypothetical protein